MRSVVAWILVCTLISGFWTETAAQLSSDEAEAGAWRTYGIDDGLPYGLMADIVQDPEGRIWTGAFDLGVFRYNPDTDRWTMMEAPSDDGKRKRYPPAFRTVLRAPTGYLWASTGTDGHKPVDAPDRTVKAVEAVVNGLQKTMSVQLFQTRDGSLWVASFRHLRRFDSDQWTEFTADDGYNGDSINAMALDRNGHVWVIFSPFAGLARYDGKAWFVYNGDQLNSQKTSHLIEDRHGGIWISTDRGVMRYDGARWSAFTTTDKLEDNAITDLVEDQNGHIWVATHKGVSRYNGESWRVFTVEDGLKDDNILTLLADNKGRVWAGTLRGGLSRYDGRTWKTFTVEDGLPLNTVHRLFEDQSGRIWAVTGRGVTRYTGDAE